MPGETKYGFECGEFETLLSEALDGHLSGASKERFEAHRKECPLCGPLFADAQAGHQWLRSVGEIEPPANLVHNILVATSGIESTRLQTARPETGKAPFGERAREWWDSFFTPAASFVRQPRFAMSFGMIFFSFSLLLSAAGVKPADVAGISLRPSALRHDYNITQGRVVKFYENIRFVYEIESRVREFKRATTPAEPGPQKPTQERKNNTSGQPDQRQEQNYSREENQPVLAGMPDAGVPSTPVLRDGVEDEPPVVTVTTNRRYV